MSATRRAGEARADCVYCDREVRSGSEDLPLEYGVCPKCSRERGYFEIVYLPEADDAFLDELPFGVVRLDGEGRILAYNRGEQQISGLQADAVLGKRFFDEVAPCTNVDEFRGEFESLRLSTSLQRKDFEFLFRFPHGSARVYVTMLHDRSSRKTTLLIRRLTLDGEDRAR